MNDDVYITIADPPATEETTDNLLDPPTTEETNDNLLDPPAIEETTNNLPEELQPDSNEEL